jgi:Na+/H+-dicarboxylate symporter
MTLRLKPGTLTIGSLAGLVAGIAMGSFAYVTATPVLQDAATVLGPIGTLWSNALRMIVLPLVISQLFIAIAGGASSARTGRMGALALVIFVGMLLLGAVFVVPVTLPLLGMVHLDPATAAAIRAASGVDAAAGERTLAFGDWLVGLVPTNGFAAVSNGDILPVVVVTVLFALATRHVAAEARRLLVTFFSAVSEATMVLTGWILTAMPIGVFAVAFALSAETGFQAAGAIAWYLVVLSLLLVAFTALLYPLTAVLARMPMRRFAAGVAPSQAVALGTRSSLASLPALMEGAENRLSLPVGVSAFVLPLAVSTFKVNRTISAPFKLLFLAHLFGIPVSPAFLVIVIASVVVLSFSSPGIPSGGFLTTLPVYLAAGLPIVGLILL